MPCSIKKSWCNSFIVSFASVMIEKISFHGMMRPETDKASKTSSIQLRNCNLGLTIGVNNCNVSVLSNANAKIFKNDRFWNCKNWYCVGLQCRLSKVRASNERQDHCYSFRKRIRSRLGYGDQHTACSGQLSDFGLVPSKKKSKIIWNCERDPTGALARKP